MRIDSFDNIIDKEKNVPCLIAGCAPTIVNFPYSKFKGIYLTMGDGPLRMKELFVPKYWVNANDIFPVPEEHYDIINSFKDTTFIFADSVTYSRKREINEDFLINNLKVKWFSYDQRHFNGKPCSNKELKCCKLLEVFPGRSTIQEIFQKRFNTYNHYSTGSTVAIHALAFAILLGCNPIYLQGIELPLYMNDYKYLNNLKVDYISGSRINYIKRIHKLFNPLSVLRLFLRITRNCMNMLGLCRDKSLFYSDIKQILSDFAYLIETCNNNNISVINLSRTSTLNNIDKLKYVDPTTLNL